MDLMNRVYKPYLDKFVIIFIDDISIAQENKEYEEHLRLILGLLKNKELFDITLEKQALRQMLYAELNELSLSGYGKGVETGLDRTPCTRSRSWLPYVRDLGELIKHESHKSNYFIHPGSDKIYHNLKWLYRWPEHRSRHRHQKYPIENGKT
ncbi:hypothetical protein Tco_0930605 [Tanacetum coccineum]